MTKRTPKKTPADKEWADLQRDLETLGEQLGSLSDHSAKLGKTVVANLDAQYKSVKRRAATYRRVKEAQLNAAHEAASQQAALTQNTLTDAGVKSAAMAKDTAKQVWERSEPLRQGAQEVGHGLVRAWSEIATSFGKAAEKIQTDKVAGQHGHKAS
jgi:hypothetical protein